MAALMEMAKDLGQAMARTDEFQALRRASAGDNLKLFRGTAYTPPSGRDFYFDCIPRRFYPLPRAHRKPRAVRS